MPFAQLPCEHRPLTPAQRDALLDWHRFLPKYRQAHGKLEIYKEGHCCLGALTCERTLHRTAQRNWATEFTFVDADGTDFHSLNTLPTHTFASALGDLDLDSARDLRDTLMSVNDGYETGTRDFTNVRRVLEYCATFGLPQPLSLTTMLPLLLPVSGV